MWTPWCAMSASGPRLRSKRASGALRTGIATTMEAKNDLHRWQRIGLMGTLAVTLMHAALVWGHTGLWGDAGRWKHEISRFIHGETLYRDFSWPYPPMALWVMGWIGRVFGDSVNVFFTVSTIV